jgi:16S rRNA (cytidine1402-2'-O)-methyltransferase
MVEEKQKKGTLHLIPVGLSQTPANVWLPEVVQQQAGALAHYVAENAKTARAFLKQLALQRPIQEINIQTLPTRSDDPSSLARCLEPLLAGHDLGLVSEAGCPAVADPGARLVALAHDMGVTIQPWVGPSSIILGLMSSGLDGQRFAFHGYAPIKPAQRERQLQQWEQLSARLSQTQILIETPYRNEAMYQSLIETLGARTRLCIACDLTGEKQWVRTQSIAQWKKGASPPLAGLPTLFLFQA